MSSPQIAQEPSHAQLQESYKVQVLDKDGGKHTFGDLVKDKKVAVIFIRHFCELSSLSNPCHADERVRSLSGLYSTARSDHPALFSAIRYCQYVPAPLV